MCATCYQQSKTKPRAAKDKLTHGYGDEMLGRPPKDFPTNLTPMPGDDPAVCPRCKQVVVRRLLWMSKARGGHVCRSPKFILAEAVQGKKLTRT